MEKEERKEWEERDREGGRAVSSRNMQRKLPSPALGADLSSWQN
jgi:hypothetical protein